ncbi:hypothetical protein QNS29_002730 [Vibrio parahaemolyticus]|nr:hypothetical protein [Vibrio parahaemolyticus]
MNALSSLPTDILYKFIALTGLLIAIGVPILINQQKSKIFANLLEVSRDIHDLKRQRIELKKRERESQSLEGIEKDNEIIYLIDEFELVEARLVSITNKNNELEKTYDLLKGNIKIVLAIVIGFTISSGGFFYWYQNNQKLNDEILELKLKELRLKVDNPVHGSVLSSQGPYDAKNSSYNDPPHHTCYICNIYYKEVCK